MPRRAPWAPMPRREAILAEAQRREIDVQLVRNGSRGLFWLEPLVEVEVAGRPPCLRAGEPRQTSPACSRPVLHRERRRPRATAWRTGRPRRSPTSSASSG